MDRSGIYPTHDIDGLRVRAGYPTPLGTSRAGGHGINFAVFSRHATACALVLFRRGEQEPFAEIGFLPPFRVGHVFAMIVFDIDAEDIEYAYRMDGPFDISRGHRFDRRALLLDPYAQAISGLEVWGEEAAQPQLRSRIFFDTFSWEQDRQTSRHAIEDLIIYEMHVRGFTQHESAGVSAPGTFEGITERIEHLKTLGVNAVELMPIFEFDERDSRLFHPKTGKRLMNYWGYNTIGFFAPKAGFARGGRDAKPQAELKRMVRALHQAQIEVILDVVYNHTAESDTEGPVLNFRGLDNKTYYMLDPRGGYLNFSGTGNTLNCNHPVVRQFVLDSLRHWASEYHINGFRFDLASILGRDQGGEPMNNPPLLEQLAYDPVLADCKLIAEAWDAGGLYQVGKFPGYGRFAEWNGRYRDTMRRFLRGEPGLTKSAALAISGSPDLYGGRAPGASINFLTCHDGFSLHDLYTYERKRNEENAEQNRDGSDQNLGWNCGVEGLTDRADVLALRGRMMRNAVALLMTSQGVPMLRMGDEFAQSTHGNNNPYCHDAPFNWLDWSRLESEKAFFRFVRCCVAFRRKHPALRQRMHLAGVDRVRSGQPDMSWHGLQPWQPDWAPYCRTLAFMLDGDHVAGGDDDIYVAANMHWQPHPFIPPVQPGALRWHLFADTFAALPR